MPNTAGFSAAAAAASGNAQSANLHSKRRRPRTTQWMRQKNAVNQQYQSDDRHPPPQPAAAPAPANQKSAADAVPNNRPIAPVANVDNNNKAAKLPLLKVPPNQQQQQQQRPRRPPPRRNHKNQPNVLEDLLAKDISDFLRDCDPRMPAAHLFHQLLELMQRPADITWRMLESVRHDLMHVLNARFPDNLCRVHPFGSAISSLSFRDSDFDILVHLPTWALAPPPLPPPTGLVHGSNHYHPPDDVFNPRENLTTLIKSLTRIMRNFRTFGQINAVTGARVPIIKSVHRATATECDFSFSPNFYSVQNTFVVRYLANSDPRIKLLTMLLKFWFRVHGYLGTGKFTSYCLFQMIVYYLQQLDEPVLPPLAHFQRNVPAHVVGGWNVAFDFESAAPATRNAQSLMDLLLGFFRFYQSFAFDTLMISTLTAKTYARDTFEQTPHAGQELYASARLGDVGSVSVGDGIGGGDDGPCPPINVSRALCVQDPITLNINVGTCSNAPFVRFMYHLQLLDFDHGLGCCEAPHQLSADGFDEPECLQTATTAATAATLRHLFRPVQFTNPQCDHIVVPRNAVDLMRCARHFAGAIREADSDAGTREGDQQAMRTVWMVCALRFMRACFVELAGARLLVLPESGPRPQKPVRAEEESAAAADIEKRKPQHEAGEPPAAELETEEPQPRTHTPTKRDASGAAVHEESDAMTTTTAATTATAQPHRSPKKKKAAEEVPRICHTFHVFIERNIFASATPRCAARELRQEQATVHERLLTAESLRVHFEVELRARFDNVLVIFRYAKPKKTQLGRLSENRVYQTRLAIVAWFRANCRAFMRMYFEALDADTLSADMRADILAAVSTALRVQVAAE